MTLDSSTMITISAYRIRRGTIRFASAHNRLNVMVWITSG